MPTARHVFAGLNSDDDPTRKENGSFDAAINIHIEPGFVLPASGNVLVPYALPTTGVNRRLGGFEDGSTGTAVSLLHNSAGRHRLIRYDPLGNGGAGAETTLLEWGGLNLTPDLVVQGDILDGLLVYLDAAGEMRCVNLARAAAGYYTERTLIGGGTAGGTIFRRELLLSGVSTIYHYVTVTPGFEAQAGTYRRVFLAASGRYEDVSPLLYTYAGAFVDFGPNETSAGLPNAGVTALGTQTYLSPQVPGATRLESNPFLLHLIKRPPAAAPVVMREALTTETGLSQVASTAWQFAARYRYLDGEVSVLSARSRVLFPLSQTDVRRSAVRVTLPAAERVGVREIEILARSGPDLTWLVAALLPNAQSAVSDATGTEVSFLFTGATTGVAVPATESGKDAESLWPAGAATVARSRPWVANTLEGYVTPAPVLTTAVVVAAPTGGFTRVGYSRTVQRSGVLFTYYYAQVTTGFNTQAGTYQRVTRIAGDYYALTAETIYTYQQAFVDLLPGEGLVSGLPQSGVFSVPPMQVDADPDTRLARSTWPSRSRYRVGIQFRDGLGRPAGVGGVRSVDFPAQDYAVPVARALSWQLPAGNQAALIPAWAATYQLVVSRNERQGTSLALRVAAIWSSVVLASAGTAAVYGSPGQSAPSLWLDIRPLTSSGLGYVFAPGSGDRVRFVDSNYEAPIQEQRGDYLLIPWVGAVGADVPYTGRTPRIEIYSPRTSIPTDTFYETGPVYAVEAGVDGAGNATRQFSTRSGELVGEAWLIERVLYRAVSEAGAVVTYGPDGTNYWVEASSPSADQPALQLGVERGRPALAVPTELQQVRRRALLRFGGVKVAGTQLNGLSQWEPLSQFDELPQEQGAVTRLSVADQTASDGSIMLVNQERGEVSLSLGQSQIRTADGDTLLAISKQVVGGANTLRGGYGCTDAGSVVPYAGKVFYYCRHREELLRYDRNGLVPLALVYKSRQRLEATARLYAGARVTGCFDPRRKEYLLTFQPVGALPGTTLVFSDRREAWADRLSAVPGAGLAVGSELVTWRAGALWRHTVDAPLCSFFGVATPAQLTFTLAQPGGAAKQFKDVAVESASLWLPTDLKTDTGQTSRMLAPFFTQREGVYRAGIRRAINSPGFATIFHALHNGLPLIGTRLTLTLTAPAGAAPLTAVAVSWTPRSGQNMGA